MHPDTNKNYKYATRYDFGFGYDMLSTTYMQFFAGAGFPCPTLVNPADHYLRCINSDFDNVMATLRVSTKLQVLILSS